MSNTNETKPRNIRNGILELRKNGMASMADETEGDLNRIIAWENQRLNALGLQKQGRRRSNRLIKVAAIFLLLGGIASLLLGVSNAHGQQQGNQFLPSTTQTLPLSIQQQPPPTAKFNPPIQQQPQQQLPNQQQQYSPQS